MAGKPKKTAATEAEKYPRKMVPCHCDNRDDADQAGRAFAQTLTSPAVSAYRVVNAANPQNLRDEIDVPGMLAVLEQQAAAVHRGDLTQAEAMLMTQATALQSLFAYLTERAMAQSHMPNIDGFLKLALRAQNQCRATLETLAAIKNPPMVIARQANVTTGPQQVVNGMAAPSRAREIETGKNQLLVGDQDGHRLDTRAAGAAIGSDTSLEAVGKIDRP
ncbi:MAG: hypothetical protein N3C63_07465 [Rhodocyclaceae bacterium]|nr:hypothetical protein [Rhodocyclaceae bacterium]